MSSLKLNRFMLGQKLLLSSMAPFDARDAGNAWRICRPCALHRLSFFTLTVKGCAAVFFLAGSAGTTMRWLVLGALFLLVSGGGGMGNGEGVPIQDILVASGQVRAGTEGRLISHAHTRFSDHCVRSPECPFVSFIRPAADATHPAVEQRPGQSAGRGGRRAGSSIARRAARRQGRAARHPPCRRRGEDGLDWREFEMQLL